MRRDNYSIFYNRIAGTAFKVTDCLKLTRPDGAVYRFTSFDRDLTITEPNGRRVIYKAADSFKMTAVESEIGLAVSNMDVDVLVSDESITDNDLKAGKFDNSKVELFAVAWSGGNQAVLPLRTSWVGEIRVTGLQFRADLRGLAQRLQNVFVSTTSLECRWTFCDSKCGLSATTYSSNVTVTSVQSQEYFNTNLSSGLHGKLRWGSITWLTGANAGLSMEIVNNVDGNLRLFLPMPYAVNIGDTARVLQGCNKSLDACTTRFGNARRFGGEPFLVGSDFLVSYPKMVDDDSENDDGGSKF